MNLIEMLMNAQNGQQIHQLAKNFGIADEQAQSAVSALLPSITGSLRNSMSSQAGLGSLLEALQKGNHQKYIDDPNSVTDRASVQDGNAILGHLLGNKERSRQVATEASAATGLDENMLKKMLPLVAGMAMGSLSKRASASGLGGGQATATSEKENPVGSLLSFLDADQDGSVLDDLAGMAAKFFRR